LAGQPAIFVDGTLALLMAHDMTLVGDASFNGGMFLVAAAVDRVLKGSVAGESMNKSFGREVRENGMS
jgi:hypothetical protein